MASMDASRPTPVIRSLTELSELSLVELTQLFGDALVRELTTTRTEEQIRWRYLDAARLLAQSRPLPWSMDAEMLRQFSSAANRMGSHPNLYARRS